MTDNTAETEAAQLLEYPYHQPGRWPRPQARSQAELDRIQTEIDRANGSDSEPDALEYSRRRGR